MKETLRENLINEKIWMRAVFMILFLIVFWVVEFLIFFAALFQFVTVLLTNRTNEAVLRLSNNLSFFALEIFQYLTFNSNLRPFPFSAWPDKEPDENTQQKDDVGVAEFEEITSDTNSTETAAPK